MSRSIHLLLSSVMTLFLSTQALAAGPSTGGGGDAVILPDDSVVLADPFLDMGGQQPNNMPPLRALNPRILMAVKSYLEAAKDHLESLSPHEANKKKKKDESSKDEPSVEVKPESEVLHSDIAKLMKELSTRKNKLRVYAVRNQEELAMYCAPGGRKSYVLPTGARVEQVACTAGQETFLVEPLFVRMSLKDQSLLMIHERLTTLRDVYGGKNYSAIARFTTGLSLYLELYREQYKEQYRKLKPDEQKVLANFYIAIEEIERRNSEVDEDSFQWTVAPFGGGRMHNMAEVGENALVTLGVTLDKGSYVDDDAVIKNSFSRKPVTVIASANALVDGVEFSDNAFLSLDEDSKVLRSTISGNVSIGKQSEISSSNIKGNCLIKSQSRVFFSDITGTCQIGLNSNVVNISVSGIIEIGNQTEILHSSLWYGTYSIGDQSKIIKTTVKSQYNSQAKLTMENQSEVRHSTIEGSLKVRRESQVVYSITHGDVWVWYQSHIQSSILNGAIGVGSNASIKDSKIHASLLTVLDNGELEDFEIAYEVSSQIQDVKVDKIKSGKIDQESIKHLPANVEIPSVDKSWLIEDKEEVYYNLDRKSAKKFADYLKGSHIFENSGLSVEIGSSFKYKIKDIFTSGYNFIFQQTKYRIRLDSQALPIETRPNVYTVYNNLIVPATGGKALPQYTLSTSSGSYRTPDHRLARLPQLFQELGFDVKENPEKQSEIIVTPKIQPL